MLPRVSDWPSLMLAVAFLMGASSCGGRERTSAASDAGGAENGGTSTGGTGGSDEGGARSGSPTGGTEANDAGGTGRGGSENAIWGDSSEAVEITYWEFFGGSMRYRKTREQLTAEELALLGQLQVIEQNSTCVLDGAWAEVWVTTDGRTRSYSARSADAVCGNSEPYVGFGAVLALLQAAG